MKKLLKRKVNIFGKSIPMFVIALLGVALVSAALVPYLSNTIFGTVNVDSPMAMSTVQGTYDDSEVKLTFTDTHGGAEINYKVWTKNLGINDIDSYPIITIISPNYDWAGNEFTSVNFKDANYPTDGIEILDYLYVVDDIGSLQLFKDGSWDNVANLRELRIVFDNGSILPNGYEYPGESESWNEITMTTALNIAPDTYTIKLCHVNDLETGSCE